jgi:DNA-3-methyladenine glycosylase I
MIQPHRCPWVPEGDLLYQRYHDIEWGVPVHDDRKIFEFLVLEGAQAGLSWITVLRKRPAYRKAFANFNVRRVAAFTGRDVARLLRNPGIIRNRQKVVAAVNNAKRFLEVQREFGSFAKYAWKFVHNRPLVHQLKTNRDYPITIPEAEAWSVDLKKRGFKFVGPTIIYAHMQATGMVNDHVVSCFRYGLGRRAAPDRTGRRQSAAR